MKATAHTSGWWTILALLLGCGARSVSPQAADGGTDDEDAGCELRDGPAVRSYLVWAQGTHVLLELSREGLVAERFLGENDANRVVASGPFVLHFARGSEANLQVSTAPAFVPVADVPLGDGLAGVICGVAGRRAFVLGRPPEAGYQIFAIDLEAQAVVDTAPIDGFDRNPDCVVCGGRLCIIDRVDAGEGVAIAEPDPLRIVDTDPASAGVQTVLLSRNYPEFVGARGDHVFIYTSDDSVEIAMPGVSVESVALASPWSKQILMTSEELGTRFAAVLLVDPEHLWYFAARGLGVYDPSTRALEERSVDWPWAPWGLLPGPGGTLVAWGRDGVDLLYAVLDPCAGTVLFSDRRSDSMELQILEAESAGE